MKKLPPQVVSFGRSRVTVYTSVANLWIRPSLNESSLFKGWSCALAVWSLVIAQRNVKTGKSAILEERRPTCLHDNCSKKGGLSTRTDGEMERSKSREGTTDCSQETVTRRPCEVISKRVIQNSMAPIHTSGAVGNGSHYSRSVALFLFSNAIYLLFFLLFAYFIEKSLTSSLVYSREELLSVGAHMDKGTTSQRICLGGTEAARLGLS